MEAYYQSSIMPRELGNDRDSRTIAIYDIKRVSLTTFKFRFIDNDWRLIYKKSRALSYQNALEGLDRIHLTFNDPTIVR